LNFFIWPVILVGTFLTYNDAVRIGAGRLSNKEKTFSINTWNPITWGLIVLILFPLSLPIYLHNRNIIATTINSSELSK
jgi:hypothetical protein